MGRFSILIYSCITLILSNCCLPKIQKKFYTTEYGSNRPLKNKFKLAKKTTINNVNLITEKNIVYTKIDSIYLKNVKTKKTELKIIKTFERYFKTGHYIRGTVKNFSSPLNDFNNLKSGVVGYYKIQDNKIQHEYFLVTAHNCGAYYNTESKIIDDSITGYTKVYIDGLIGSPDW